jgi:predicted O-methyltransferase YrrM
MARGDDDTQRVWDAVDEYFERRLIPSDDALSAALAASDAAGLPSINVTAGQGKLLHLIARAQRARRILEIGTLGGYSTIWLARALPAGGRLVTLEIDEKHASVARENLSRAGVSERVDARVAPAAESLRALIAERAEAFDLVFIDADKPSGAAYFEAALQLSRVGTVVVVDNVVRGGAVAAEGAGDQNVEGSRAVTELIGRTSRVEATAIQTVGSKGYDGFILAVVTS